MLSTAETPFSIYRIKPLFLRDFSWVSGDIFQYHKLKTNLLASFQELSFSVCRLRTSSVPVCLKLNNALQTWLKPGGKLLISDYCCGDGNHSEEFKNYVKQRGYILYPPSQYGKVHSCFYVKSERCSVITRWIKYFIIIVSVKTWFIFFRF